MSTLLSEPRALSISFDKDNLWVELVDGRKLAVPLVLFPRLLKADSEQKERFVISGGGVGLHWEEIDEDISVKNLMLGIFEKI